jgi:hypothetical protein
MTTIDRMPLLDAMDVVTDLRLLYDPNYSQADDQLVFRDLQKRHLPALDREQFETLFAEWQDRYAGKCVQDRMRARNRIQRHAEAQVKRIPPLPPFKCVCGAQTKDPLDPAWFNEHQPHCQRAGEERIARERERPARQG